MFSGVITDADLPSFGFCRLQRIIPRARPGQWARVIRRDRRLEPTIHRNRPIASRSPWQNGYAERIIGSIRRVRMDHAIIIGEAHLRRTFKS
jgi:hypothetical protein